MFTDHLLALENKLEGFIADEDGLSEHSDDGKEYQKIFMTILRDSCTLLRDAETAGVPDFDAIFSRVDRLIDKAISFSYGDAEIYDFIPSFAHVEGPFPLLEDKFAECTFAHGVLEGFLPFFRRSMKIHGDTELPAEFRFPSPWTTTMKPHPNTTPLSRFRDGIPAWSALDASPFAVAVYEARCEVSSASVNAPIRMTMSSGAACLAVPSMGGYKNRTPILHYFLNEEDNDDFGLHYTEVGLSEIAYHSTTDEQRKLIILGDRDRIKSYAWGPTSNTIRNAKNYGEPLPTHTLDSECFHGPLAVLSSRRVIRAGQGSAGVWNLDTLPTHGPKGKKRIGKKYNTEEMWRDDPEGIEVSMGSSSDATITFSDPTLAPGQWHAHPSTAGVMLCASDARATNNYSCLTLDLENGGKTVSRYLGHGGTIQGFSTSAADQNVFATACSDGYARLYDIRHALPVMTFDAGKQSQMCPAALIVHPDGIPTMFTGTDTGEHIAMWDVRARTIVYELATGNNSVNAMAWDPVRNCLYAATECNYVDRLGRHYDYRTMKMPKPPKAEDNDDVEMLDGDDGADDPEDDDEDEYEDEERCWPTRAHHREDYFGYTFDAGDHRIYRYAFKTNADNQVLPEYGYATLERDGYF